MRPSFIRLCSVVAYGYIVLMGLHTTHAAPQNLPDCTPNWVWGWIQQPTLTILAPPNAEDECVGPVTVGAATPVPTPGQKGQYDANACPESPIGWINVTTVNFDPVNTWEIYVGFEGVSPISGGGTTANFTKTQGGDVAVQFKTDATIYEPPLAPLELSAGVVASPLRVFEVVSLLPDEGCEVDDSDGDPNTRTFAVHTGEGVVTVTAEPRPSVYQESELPPCWQLTGAQGTSRLSRTINKAQAQETLVSCTAGISYKRTKVFIYYFQMLVYKWANDPGYLPVDGCGKLHALQPFSYRAEVIPESTPLHWEYWDLSGFNTLLASGSGREFSQSSGYTSTLLVRFYIDCSQNLQFDPGEPELSSEFTVKNDTLYGVTMNHHVDNDYTLAEFENHVIGARSIARRRDRWMASGGDVHCRVQIYAINHDDGSPFKVFGESGDGLDSPWWSDYGGNIGQVLAQPGTYKVVSELRKWVTGVGWTYPVGTTGGSIVIRSDATDAPYLHEFMHTRGASDRWDVVPYVMYGIDAEPKDSIDANEAAMLE